MKNFIKYLKIHLLLIFLLFIYTIFCAHSYSNAISAELSNAVFRLHVLANSDSEEDQHLKLKVRDALLSYMNTLSSNCNTKEEAIQIAKQHKDEFQTIAENVISENNTSTEFKLKFKLLEVFSHNGLFTAKN